ncbi:uncharacterized protein SOCG_01858 [Schizosaccharomyces octosporus yFS286]|uniref:Uncharacterized protein n=1 Tax=Schizosaccharomyces octosporus (strain yFS286) TaxID=483514 RepID=S9PW03_SCHOY|nr:uncharacterized protein SOCG_01858 [Schizosaccharomyces octosporus yFS286]EPX71643.1 hypothetical protein SOCG_01858 [Schizosaccharomyces octosporus yFS286]
MPMKIWGFSYLLVTYPAIMLVTGKSHFESNCKQREVSIYEGRKDDIARQIYERVNENSKRMKLMLACMNANAKASWTVNDMKCFQRKCNIQEAWDGTGSLELRLEPSTQQEIKVQFPPFEVTSLQYVGSK